MSNLIRSEEAFTRFIEEYRDERKEVKYEKALSEMAVKGKLSLIVDFKDLYEFDDNFANEILTHPLNYLSQLDEAVLSNLRMRDYEFAMKIKRVHVRFRGLPVETPLRRIWAEHINRLVMVTGIIVRASAVKFFIVKAAYRCTSCGETIILDQIDQSLKTPVECPSCNSKRGFKLLTEDSAYIDVQQLFISETEEKRAEFCVEIFDDIVKTAEEGDHVIITGVVGARHLNKTVEATLYIKGNYIEIVKKAETYIQDTDLQVDLSKVLGVISEMERIPGVVQDEDLFTTLLNDHGIARSEAARLIGVLIRDGTIYSPRPGYYKKTI